MNKTYLIKVSEVFGTSGDNYSEVENPAWESFDRLELVPDRRFDNYPKVGEVVEFSFSEYETDGYYGWGGRMKGTVLFIAE